MRVLIIEDEKLAAERLEHLLLEIDPTITVAATLSSVRASRAWLSAESVDLLFLDIQLSDGISFAIFDGMDIRTPVIFTTAYDSYAIDAFSVNSIDYLLKPVRSDELRRALEKHANLRHATVPDLAGLLEAFRARLPEYKRRFLVQLGERLKNIAVEDVAYFHAMEKNVFLTTFDGRMYPADAALEKLEGLLDPARFFRINRKMIVNLAAIKGMIAYSRSRVRLDLQPAEPKGVEALVSVERAADFKAWLDV